MPYTPNRDHSKSFADSVGNIRKLGQRLAALQGDVDAIKRLAVDDNGDAQVLVSVGKSVSLHIGLRLPPAAMLLAKHEEVCRSMDALEFEFNEMLDRAAALVSRCKPAPAVPPAAPHLAVDLKRMEREIRELVTSSSPPGPNLSRVGEPLAPPLRPRIARPGLSNIPTPG
jgi:hypothetical protein